MGWVFSFPHTTCACAVSQCVCTDFSKVELVHSNHYREVPLYVDLYMRLMPMASELLVLYVYTALLNLLAVLRPWCYLLYLRREARLLKAAAFLRSRWTARSLALNMKDLPTHN